MPPEQAIEPERTPQIELRDLSKSYATDDICGATHRWPFRRAVATSKRPAQSTTAAVKELSLAVQQGEIISLLGPSGCGKSTTLRLIAGLEAPDSGEILLSGRQVAGRDIWVAPEHRRTGFVFQDYALFPHLTVARNIAFSLGGPNGRPASHRQARVAELLDLLGLSALGSRYPHQLSGGQQQRVALARALAPDPEVVLLDEPFSSLDADNRASIREQVRDILKRIGTTTVFVTHDQEEALRMGDRVAIMKDGRLEQVGTPEEVFQHPATRFVAEFLGLSYFLPAVVTTYGLETELGFHAQPIASALHAHEGMPVDVLVRPDDLALQPDPLGEARIVRHLYRGMDYLYDVELPSGLVVQCLGEHTAKHEAGTRVHVQLAPGHALVCFPRSERDG
jgi:iron(III) transport system ATP-binding protein